MYLQRYLLASYVLFIAYVSLSPFSGWQEQGLFFSDVLTAPFAQTFTLFDFSLNCASYFPLGFLLAYMLSNRWPPVQALLLAMLSGLALSVAMEYTQMYLPTRVSSSSDLLSNGAGTLLGAALSLIVARHAWFAHVKNLHESWFKHGKNYDFGLALVALWIFAQVNPSLPMLGSVFVSAVARWPFDIVPETPFNWLGSLEVALNLLLMGALLTTLLRTRRHTVSALALLLCTVTLIKFLAAAILLKSWALLFWVSSEAVLGIILGVFLLLIVLRLSSKGMLLAGSLAAVFYLILLQDLLVGSTPSNAMRLYHWHYVHMLNYNGLSQLVNLLFPVLLLLYLWRTGILRK